jgi:hypothetical protein
MSDDDLTPLQREILDGYVNDPFFLDKVNTKGLIKKSNGFWYRDNQVVAPVSARDAVLHMGHDEEGAHLGMHKTYQRLARFYWWVGMKDAVTDWVHSCDLCQRNKSHWNKSQGLLQPLPIPSSRWESVSMDFIVSLPVSPDTRNDSIMVIVDRLTKLVKFIPCKTTMTAHECVELFLNQWVLDQGCGMPKSIVSDRDSKFTCRLWTEFMRVWKVEKKMSTSFHPQTDGQTERMNRTLEEMLRHVINPSMSNWEKMLPKVQFAYNDSVHASTGKTPFMAALGHTPITPLTPVDDGSISHPVVHDLLSELRTIVHEVRSCLQKAQQRQATYADQFRREKVFSVGERVLLSTANLHIKGPKVAALGSKKLLPKFIGPFKVKECVGNVAYKLDLPDTLKIHPVFHVSLLHKYHDSTRHGDPPPVVMLADGSLEYEVEEILDVQLTAGGKPRRYLVHWLGYDAGHNTWEPASHLANCADVVEDFWRGRRARIPLPRAQVV